MRQTQETHEQEQVKALAEGEVITGKQRLEYAWKDLDDAWRVAFADPISKAFEVYMEHNAIAGVPQGQFVEPKRILPSRMVLTNKGGPTLAEATLKARWVFGGHKDPEAGQHQTASPTVSLIGHNLLVFIAVQKSWIIMYEDVSAAFLQGQPLPESREIYVKVPTGYPQEALKKLRAFLGSDARSDLVRLTKGGFGLPESPRLWYLEYRQTLMDLGGHEMRLIPGLFCFYDEKGELHGIAAIHVDDTRYAGAPSADGIWAELHRRLNFGKKRQGTDEGWSKFCGRYEKQDPITLEVKISMDQYNKDIPFVKERAVDDLERPLSDEEKKMISSVIGQINWSARQCRYDLSFAASHCQQLAGKKDPSALSWVNKVVRRAKQPAEMVVRKLGCPLEDLVVLSISDATYNSQPGGGSQGGLLVGLAHPDICSGPAPVVIVEGVSSRLQRVVRCSMSAELSQAATAYEHGDYVRAVFSEIMGPKYDLKSWKWYASRWKHILVLDAKVAYDALQSDNPPSDRKLIVDIAILRESLNDKSYQNFIRWVPGKEIPSDGMTKWYANGALEKILRCGEWSLSDTEAAAEARKRAADRKRHAKANSKGGICGNEHVS